MHEGSETLSKNKVKESELKPQVKHTHPKKRMLEVFNSLNDAHENMKEPEAKRMKTFEPKTPKISRINIQLGKIIFVNPIFQRKCQ